VNKYRVPGTQYPALTPSLKKSCAVGLAVLALAAMSASQQAQPAANGAGSVPTIAFSLDFPKANPSHYSISVDAAGHARYESMGAVAEGGEEQPYQMEFEVSAANRERIFALAKQARYFAGKVDSGNRNVAFMGTKQLSYQDGRQSHTAQYNYSSVEAVRNLTEWFQGVSSTLEYGRRLSYYHRYQKLALDEELRGMETLARSSQLSEIQSVAPVLQEIVDDSSVINVVRARAQALIEMGKVPATGH
jgi:hypothetical protein